MTSILEKLLPEDCGVVSLVGAGGKTTLMFHLAKELEEVGETILTTTTTKIMMPAKEKSSHVIVSSRVEQVVVEAKDLLKSSLHVAAGREHNLTENKLIGFEPEAVKKFWESGLFHWILVEADGAAQRPLKAPAAHEPVIPECSTHVVAVVGLDAVGRSLNDQWVFRPDLYSQLAGIPLNSPITEKSVVAVILDERGMMKGCPPTAKRCVFLNKAEEDHTFAAGKRIATILYEKGEEKLERILIGSGKREPLFAKVYMPEIN
jgi:probable selenium-dependent hydroxylase accessory protein YqeC